MNATFLFKYLLLREHIATTDCINLAPVQVARNLLQMAFAVSVSFTPLKNSQPMLQIITIFISIHLRVLVNWGIKYVSPNIQIQTLCLLLLRQVQPTLTSRLSRIHRLLLKTLKLRCSKQSYT